MGKGMRPLPRARIALQYSTARMSLGRSSTAGSPPRSFRARLRAAGKDRPSSRWGRRASPNWGERSCRAVSKRVSRSAVSAPKEMPSTPSRSRISTPPAAKPSADRRLTVTGQLQHQVRPGKQGRPGPHLSGEYRRLAPLNIQPTHETHHCHLWVLLPEKGQLPGMAQMKGIVFANNAHCPHRRDPPVFFKNFQRKTCRSGENEIKYP